MRIRRPRRRRRSLQIPLKSTRFLSALLGGIRRRRLGRCGSFRRLPGRRRRRCPGWRLTCRDRWRGVARSLPVTAGPVAQRQQQHDQSADPAKNPTPVHTFRAFEPRRPALVIGTTRVQRGSLMSDMVPSPVRHYTRRRQRPMPGMVPLTIFSELQCQRSAGDNARAAPSVGSPEPFTSRSGTSIL